jgi:hypothetical protein
MMRVSFSTILARNVCCLFSWRGEERRERPEPQLGLAPHVDSDDPPARLPVAAKTHTHRPYTDGASCCLGHGTSHATATQLVTCSSGPWNGTASTGLDCTSHRALTPLTRPAGCAFAAAVRCRSDVPIRHAPPDVFRQPGNVVMGWIGEACRSWRTWALDGY